MAIWDFFSKVEEKGEIVMDYIPSISVEKNMTGILTEQFKGEVAKTDVKFPEELGEEHPFDFKILAGLYSKYGLFNAVIEKYVDYVVGPGFFIETDDERAKQIIEDFMQDVNFDTILRKWCKEAMIKGNGFIEIGGSKKEGVKGLKVLNADYMYVKRDKYGKIKKYNQYKGGFDRFSKEKVIEFEPDNIAHVPFTVVGDCAYGLGIGYPALTFMNNQIQQSRDMHQIQTRKANSPLHAKLGKIDGTTKIIPKPSDVAAFGKDMENMSNKTEWATDPLVELSVVDFGNVGDKFEKSLAFDMDMLIYAFQIPSVLLGTANINEGIAKVQMDAFQRRIQSIQAELEKIIETKIFKRVLQANGLDVHVEFEWGAPSTLEVEGRMTLITDLIKSPTTSMTLSKMLEEELVQLLKLDGNEYEKNILDEENQKEEERKRLESQAIPIVPGQNKSFPKAPTAPKPAQPKPAPVKQMADLNEIKAMIKDLQKQKRVVIKKNNIVPESAPIKPKQDAPSNKNYEYEKECAHCEESWDSVTDIEEWLGFNYKKFLGHIENAVNEYDFAFIKGVTESEIAAGMLSTDQVEKVRKILGEGFSKGQGMNMMAKNMDKIGIKDLYRMEDGALKLGASGLPILARSAEKRSIGIVRTEVTRLANQGSVAFYKKENIKQVKWIASFGERTCPECEGYDGQIYEIGQHPSIPAHPLCRCTLGPVTEIQ